MCNANFITFIIKAPKNKTFSIDKARFMTWVHFHKSPEAEKFLIQPDWRASDLAKKKSQSQSVAATHPESAWHGSPNSYTLKINNIQTVRKRDGRGVGKLWGWGRACWAESHPTAIYILLPNSKAGNSGGKCEQHRGQHCWRDSRKQAWEEKQVFNKSLLLLISSAPQTLQWLCIHNEWMIVPSQPVLPQ